MAIWTLFVGSLLVNQGNPGTAGPDTVPIRSAPPSNTPGIGGAASTTPAVGGYPPSYPGINPGILPGAKPVETPGPGAYGYSPYGPTPNGAAGAAPGYRPGNPVNSGASGPATSSPGAISFGGSMAGVSTAAPGSIPFNTPGSPSGGAPYPVGPSVGSAAPMGIVSGSPSGISAAQPQNLSAATALAAEILATRAGGPPAGRATSLLSILSSLRSRSQQTEAVHAYWRLTEAIGTLNLAMDETQVLSQLRDRPEEAAELRAAQAMAASDSDEASLQLVAAQHDLAARLAVSSVSALPWPSDAPYVGPYRTYFEQLFANRSAPERAATINRTLPYRLKAVDAHAAAVAASDEAFETIRTQQAGGEARLHDAVRGLHQRTVARKAFWTAVCRYNHDIADYALSVVSPNMSPEVVVGTLIRQARPASRPVAPRAEITGTRAIVPAGYDEPALAPTSSTNGSTNLQDASSVKSPDLPPRSSPAAPPMFNPPANALPIEPSEGRTPNNSGSYIPPSSSGTSGAIFPETQTEDPPLQAPAEIHLNDTPPNQTPAGGARQPLPRNTGTPIGQPPMVPVRPQGEAASGNSARTSLMPIAITVKQQIIPPGVQGATAAVGPTTSSEATAAADRFFRPAAGDKETPLSLSTCIAQAGSQRRPTLVHAYWEACKSSATCRILVGQQAAIQDITNTLAGSGPQAGAMLAVTKAAGLRSSALVCDAEADRREAITSLAILSGKPLNQQFEPSTLPFSGKYPVPSLSGDWTLRRITAMLQIEESAVDHAADAVTAADQFAQSSMGIFRSGQGHSSILDALDMQAEASRRFVTATMEYNQTIADYAARTSGGASSDRFLAALMVR